MTERVFTVEFKGVRYAVTVEHTMDDPMGYQHVCAISEEDGKDYLDKIRHSPDFAVFDRAVDTQMNEWMNTGYDDAMDAVHAAQEKTWT